MKLSIGMVLAGCVSGLWAQQGPPYYPRMQWVKEGRLVHNPFGKSYLMGKTPQPLAFPPPDPGVMKGRPAFLRPPEHMILALIQTSEGRFATARRKVDGQFWLDLLKATATGWERVGELQCPPEVATGGIYPLENGQFLVLGYPVPTPAFSKEGTQGWVASIYRQKPGSLTLEWQRHLEVGARMSMGSSAAKAFTQPVVTDDHLVVCSQAYGLYWVFSRRNGACLREGRIYPEVTDQVVQKNEDLYVVLNAQPLQDGTVLIAARPRKGIAEYLEGASVAYRTEQNRIKEVMRLRKVGPAAGGRPELTGAQKGLMKDIARSQEEQARAFPPVTWYELDPGKGRVKEVPEPPGAWPLIRSQAELDAYFWLPDAQGRIAYHSLDLATRSDKPVLPVKAVAKP